MERDGGLDTFDHDPKAVAAYIREHDGQSHARGRAIRNTARELATTDPAEAIEFVTSLEGLMPGQRTGSYSDIIRN